MTAHVMMAEVKWNMVNSGDFFNNLPENGTVEITKYFGSAIILDIPTELDTGGITHGKVC